MYLCPGLVFIFFCLKLFFVCGLGLILFGCPCHETFVTIIQRVFDCCFWALQAGEFSRIAFLWEVAIGLLNNKLPRIGLRVAIHGLVGMSKLSCLPPPSKIVIPELRSNFSVIRLNLNKAFAFAKLLIYCHCSHETDRIQLKNEDNLLLNLMQNKLNSGKENIIPSQRNFLVLKSYAFLIVLIIVK